MHLDFHYDFLTLKIYDSVPPDTDILKYSFKSMALNQYGKLNLDTFSPFTECYGCLIGKWVRPRQACLLTNAMLPTRSSSQREKK